MLKLVLNLICIVLMTTDIVGQYNFDNEDPSETEDFIDNPHQTYEEQSDPYLKEYNDESSIADSSDSNSNWTEALEHQVRYSNSLSCITQCSLAGRSRCDELCMHSFTQCVHGCNMTNMRMLVHGQRSEMKSICTGYVLLRNLYCLRLVTRGKAPSRQTKDCSRYISRLVHSVTC